MSAKLHHTLRPISAAAATTAATGYPASNVAGFEVGKPWRSTSTASNNLDIDLGSAASGTVLCIQHANAATCVVSHGSAAYTTVNDGTQTLHMDRHGRRKLSLALSGSTRYVRIVFGAASPDDGAAYFEVGSVQCYGATLTLPSDPLLGSEANVRYAQTGVELPNGQAFALARGVARQQLPLRFRTLRTADVQQLTRIARAGLCWLDLDITASRELQWPVRHIADTQNRQFAKAFQDEAAIDLREVA